MMEPPPSARILVVGRTGSGKTMWMWQRWIVRRPRVLLIDQTGEWRRKMPGATFAVGLPDTLAKLRNAAGRGQWTIVATVSNEEFYRLIDILIPVPRLDQSPVVHLGGLTVFVDEVDRAVPLLCMNESARDLNRRSRHVGLTVLSATQRISNVNKEFTSMADAIAIMALHEPACVEYLRQLMGGDREMLEEALAWANEKDAQGISKHQVAVFAPQDGTLTLYPAVQPNGSGAP